MTIDAPTDVDRSVWKCYVGYAEGARLQTMGAILDASDTIIDPGDGEFSSKIAVVSLMMMNT